MCVFSVLRTAVAVLFYYLTFYWTLENIYLEINESPAIQQTEFLEGIILCLFQKLFSWCHLISRGAHLIIEETVHIKNLWEGLKKMAP